MKDNKKIIEVQNLSKDFYLDAGFFNRKDKKLTAVKDLSFTVNEGDCVAIVGESGCGKTTTARLLVSLYKESSGNIYYYNENDEKKDISKFSKNELKKYREKVKYIFQDPAKSLNPRLNILTILTDCLRYSSRKMSKKERKEKAIKALKEVGLKEDDLYKHSPSFSGGQRQRICIARSLIMNPRFLICDEIVSSLDLNTQNEILTLLDKLRKEKKLSIIFITHNLNIALSFCNKILVMYKGLIVEENNASSLLRSPLHPYTSYLFNSSFCPSEEENLNTDKGCPFAPYCKKKTDKCITTLPLLKPVDNGRVRCFLYD